MHACTLYRPKLQLPGGQVPAIAWKWVDCIWNVMAHAQKPDFIFRRNRWVHLSRWGGQFSRLLAVEVCASAVVMLDTPCSEVVWRVLATHSICQFPLHFPSDALPCAITFQLDSTDCNADMSLQFTVLYLTQMFPANTNSSMVRGSTPWPPHCFIPDTLSEGYYSNWQM